MSILLASLLAAAAPAAPSFDCHHASTRVEKMICADSGLAEADRVLAVAFGRVPARAALTREQRDWLARRDRCEDPACVAGRYDERISELIGRIHLPSAFERRGDRDAPASLRMAAVENGQYLFRLSALSFTGQGGDVSDGGAEGLVRIANGRGTWRNASGCVLSFVPQGSGWRIGEVQWCHSGVGVTLAGYYAR
jgi:hypothetical protein